MSEKTRDAGRSDEKEGRALAAAERSISVKKLSMTFQQPHVDAPFANSTALDKPHRTAWHVKSDSKRSLLVNVTFGE